MVTLENCRSKTKRLPLPYWEIPIKSFTTSMPVHASMCYCTCKAEYIQTITAIANLYNLFHHNFISGLWFPQLHLFLVWNWPTESENSNNGILTSNPVPTNHNAKVHLSRLSAHKVKWRPWFTQLRPQMDIQVQTWCLVHIISLCDINSPITPTHFAIGCHYFVILDYFYRLYWHFLQG